MGTILNFIILIIYYFKTFVNLRLDENGAVKKPQLYE